MKPEQVREEWLDLAEDEFGTAYDGFVGWRAAFRAAFSAVAPLIAAAERERCAGVADGLEVSPEMMCEQENASRFGDCIAAAIRSLLEE